MRAHVLVFVPSVCQRARPQRVMMVWCCAASGSQIEPGWTDKRTKRDRNRTEGALELKQEDKEKKLFPASFIWKFLSAKEEEKEEEETELHERENKRQRGERSWWVSLDQVKSYLKKDNILWWWWWWWFLSRI